MCVFSISLCAPCSGSNEQPPSKAVKRAANTPPLTATAWREKREVCLHGRLDLNGNIHTAGPAAVDSWEGTKAGSCHGENEAALEDLDIRSEESKHCICQGRRKKLNTVLVVYIKAI